MKKISIAEISIAVISKIFNWRFWIARLTKQSKIMKKIITKTLFEDDESIIIPNTIEVNQKVIGEKSEFLPTDVLKEVIKKCDDIVIMNQCFCRNANDCKDYPHDIGCIFLGPTSKKIPRAVCHTASVEEAIEHVDKADEAGLSHLIGRNKIDSVWMNVRPRKGLLTICHCCPCCCLWKVIPELDSDISDKIDKLEGVELVFDENNCKQCKKCLDDICMAGAIEFNNGKIAIDKNKCRCCGLCVRVCKYDALAIKYADKSIDSIINHLYGLIERKE